MSSLFGTISISVRALLAQQAALQTTSENISNINIPGYTRRRTVMVEAEPTFNGNVAFGNGVQVEGIESLRDRVVELRIRKRLNSRPSGKAFWVP